MEYLYFRNKYSQTFSERSVFMQILLVEDEIALSNAVKKILEQQGYFVDAVYDGENISFREHVVLNEDLNKLYVVK